MTLGAAQIDITPNPGIELCGYASRIQPSIGVLDPLYAGAILLEDGHERLLWIHCDLIAFDQHIVTAFRAWALQELNLRPEQVLLSATHTHSGPPAIHLTAAGSF